LGRILDRFPSLYEKPFAMKIRVNYEFSV